MKADLETVLSWVAEHPLAVAVAATAAILLATAAALIARAWRRRDMVAKQVIGFAVVQAGVTFIVITGVFEFFEGLVDMPVPEAAIVAVFLEAATWAAVGFIYGHGKSYVVGEDGIKRPAVGFGKAGPFFWFSVAGGGVLAVLGSASIPIAVGRGVIVGFGAFMWFLQLERFTRPKPKKKDTEWNWTLTRFLVFVGIKKPSALDIRNHPREWEVRRLARAIRLANGSWPLKWYGRRSLIRYGEAAAPDVIAEARNRWATAYVLVEQVAPTSEVMKQAIKAATEVATAPPELPVPPRKVRVIDGTAEQDTAGRHARPDELVAMTRRKAIGAPRGNAGANWLSLDQIPGLPKIHPDRKCTCHPDPAKHCGRTLVEHIQRRGQQIRDIVTKRPDWFEGRRIGKKEVETLTGLANVTALLEIGYVMDQLRDIYRQDAPTEVIETVVAVPET
jgi:hypothetical protein